MAGKTTSAGYRVPVTSEYHQQCIAQRVKVIREATARAGNDKTFTVGQYRKCNAVAQESTWKEHVHKEIVTAKDWGKSWGFLLEYDIEAEQQLMRQSPENLSFYKSLSGFPITTSNHVGKWTQRPQSKEMSRLEKLMCHKKTNTDLKDYDTN